ncbi:MAG: nucleotidyltransferase domain-containing protein [Armatimonadota bacterium]
MNRFSRNLGGIIGDNLLSVILFGSAVMGDFRPGEGDLDFVVVTRTDMSDSDCKAIFDLHDRMRTGEMGQLAVQLEGTYYPVAIMRDPHNAKAGGCYIGTSRRNWRHIDSSKNSMMDYAIIRTFGVTCGGEEIRHLFYAPSRVELLDEINRNLDANIEGCAEHNSSGFALAMFHWAPRALCFVMTGEIVSKTQGALWYASEFPDSRWTLLVSHAVGFRAFPLTPEMQARVDPLIVGGVEDFLMYVSELIRISNCNC